jgi:hypothetical protein
MVYVSGKFQPSLINPVHIPVSRLRAMSGSKYFILNSILGITHGLIQNIKIATH